MSAEEVKTNVRQKISIQQIAAISVVTAVICVLAPLSLPIGPVPVSLTNLVLYFALYVLGGAKATISCLIYLLIGFVGLPVFSGFTSGPSKLLGPTGGYLIGFIPMVILAGIVVEHYVNQKWICLLGMIAGTAICYTLGTVWLAYQAGMDFQAALIAGVIPFIPGDLLKMVLAAFAGPQIKKQLVRSGVI